MYVPKWVAPTMAIEGVLGFLYGLSMGLRWDATLFINCFILLIFLILVRYLGRLP